MDRLEGAWKVRRESGLLPPFGIHKRIKGDRGWTMLGPIPIAPFKVEGTRLRYTFLPLEDELDLLDDGTFVGRGYVLGKKFCRFRMEAEH